MMSRVTRLLFGIALSVSLLAFAEDPSEPNKPFVIGTLLGRIGNCMFEVATASAVAWDNGAEAYFPGFKRSSDEFRHIFFRCKIVPPSAPVEFEWFASPFGYQPIPFHPNMRISGYCQNEKYFSKYRDRIL